MFRNGKQQLNFSTSRFYMEIGPISLRRNFIRKNYFIFAADATIYNFKGLFLKRM